MVSKRKKSSRLYVEQLLDILLKKVPGIGDAEVLKSAAKNHRKTLEDIEFRLLRIAPADDIEKYLVDDDPYNYLLAATLHATAFVLEDVGSREHLSNELTKFIDVLPKPKI